MNRSVDSGKKTLCRPPLKSRRGRSLLLPVPRLVRHPMPSPQEPGAQVQVVRRSGSGERASIRRLPLGIIRNRHRTAMPTTPWAGRAGHTKLVQRRQGLLRGLRGDAHRQRSKLGPKPQTPNSSEGSCLLLCMCVLYWVYSSAAFTRLRMAGRIQQRALAPTSLGKGSAFESANSHLS